MSSKTDKIEETLNKNKDALAQSLEQLQDKLSTDGLLEGSLGLLRDNAGVISSTIDRAVRANPVAMAVTGVGLAWLIFGKRDSQPPARDDVVSRLQHEASRLANTDLSEEFDEWSQQIDAWREKAGKKIARIEAEALDHAESAKKGLTDKVSAARDFAAERADAVAEFAKQVQSGLAKGLEDLPEEARDRIILAREKAYRAAHLSKKTAKKGVEKTGAFVEENPLLTGLIVAAVGALVAANLPRNKPAERAENAVEKLSDASTRLMEEATELLEAERAKLKKLKG